MKFFNFIYSLFFRSNLFPIVFILTVIGIFWYLIAIPMNTEKVERKFKNLNSTEKIIQSWNLEKPKLPTPHQIVKEIVNTVFFKKITSKRSLVYHGWITLEATLAGFFLGTVLGILL